MDRTMKHLSDEHMRLYEWSGAGAGIALTGGDPKKSKRTHAWHASYSVLALLTTLLVMNGCDSKRPEERTGERVDQAVKDTPEGTSDPGATESPGSTPDQTGERIKPPGSDTNRQ